VAHRPALKNRRACPPPPRPAPKDPAAKSIEGSPPRRPQHTKQRAERVAKAQGRGRRSRRRSSARHRRRRGPSPKRAGFFSADRRVEAGPAPANGWVALARRLPGPDARRSWALGDRLGGWAFGPRATDSAAAYSNAFPMKRPGKAVARERPVSTGRPPGSVLESGSEAELVRTTKERAWSTQGEAKPDTRAPKR
jgi:hypothetical protein